MQAATRPDTSGCRRRSTPNSSKRAATWAGLIKLPASTTPAADTLQRQQVWQVRGECRAGEGHHRKHPGQQGDGERAGGAVGPEVSQRMDCQRPGAPFRRHAPAAPGQAGIERQADQQMQRRPGQQAPRQPRLCSSAAVSGQPTVLAKPAIKVMPVMALRASLP